MLSVSEMSHETSELDSTVPPFLSVRTERSRAVLRVQDRVMGAVRKFFEGVKFYEVRPAVIGPVTDPGIRGAGIASFDYYGHRYVITSSMILYKQMLIAALVRVFIFSPCVRLEKERTDRHLTEFVQVDVEAAHHSRDEIMDIAEALLVHVIKDVRSSCQDELRLLGRRLSVPRTPFRKLTFDDTAALAEELGYRVEEGTELPFEAEVELSSRFDGPFWVVGYPTSARGFYYRLDPNSPERLLDFDLMYPEGFGEAASGGEREFEYDRVVRRLAGQGLDSSRFKWYLDMLRVGVPPSAGFGIGLERLTRYICGLDDIREATPFPAVPGTTLYP